MAQPCLWLMQQLLNSKQQIVGCVSCMREEEREREREGWRVRQDEREAMKEAL